MTRMPAGVHQHGGLGVPVGLGAHVDAVHHHVDLAARLGELDDPTQDERDPVHVLGAAVRRDLRPRGEGQPVDRALHPPRELERLGDPPALGLGQRPELPARVAEEQHARHALGVAGGEVADHARDDVGLVLAERALDRHEPALAVEVVLDELARRELPARPRRARGRACARARRGRRGRAGRAAAPSARTPTAARSARPPAPPAARRSGAREASTRKTAISRGEAPSTGHPALDRHALEAEALGGRGVPGHEVVRGPRRRRRGPARRAG